MVSEAGHHHHHGDGLAAVLSSRLRLLLRGAVAALVVAALVGVALLWPSGGRSVLADELGLGGELVDATVTEARVKPCAGTSPESETYCTEVAFRVTSGATSGDEGTFEMPVTDASVRLDPGDEVVLIHQPEVDPPFQYRFGDFQRRTPLTLLWAGFVLAVVALGRWQGVRALIGLVVTGVVMVAFLFPSILDGRDPTAAALVAATLIGVVALYVTHGISDRTTVALLGTFGALAITAVLAAVVSSAAHFTGFATEDAFYLQVVSGQVDIKGLVLAGIIIGSLGVLDDVTVTQVSAVWQLRQANPGYGTRELFRAGVAIGRDHIASTVNTLVLAYAGASLPLFLVYTQAGRALGDVATGELVAVEIVRTLVGSIGLVAAVPLTTALAALVATTPVPPERAAPVDRQPDDRVRPSTDAPAAGDGPEPSGPAEPSDEDGWARFAPGDPEGW